MKIGKVMVLLLVIIFSVFFAFGLDEERDRKRSEHETGNAVLHHVEEEGFRFHWIANLEAKLEGLGEKIDKLVAEKLRDFNFHWDQNEFPIHLEGLKSLGVLKEVFAELEYLDTLECLEVLEDVELAKELEDFLADFNWDDFLGDVDWDFDIDFD